MLAFLEDETNTSNIQGASDFSNGSGRRFSYINTTNGNQYIKKLVIFIDGTIEEDFFIDTYAREPLNNGVVIEVVKNVGGTIPITDSRFPITTHGEYITSLAISTYSMFWEHSVMSPESSHPRPSKVSVSAPCLKVNKRPFAISFMASIAAGPSPACGVSKKATGS